MHWGHRIWVSLVLDPIAEVLTPRHVTEEHYRQIITNDVRACLVYGSAMSQERYVPVLIKAVA